MKTSEKNLEILAIIPARGGSKGIPRKNIKDLCGKPLIAWTIDAARRSKYVTRVVVTTDDEEIASVAQEHGAEVPFMRPKELAQDHSTDIEFITNTLLTLEKEESYNPDILLRLSPTYPLRTEKHIDEGIDVILVNDSLDSVRSIAEFPYHPYKSWKINNDIIEPLFHKSVTGYEFPHDQPRQKFPKAYIHGAVDIIRTNTIKKYGNVTGRKVGYFIMKPMDFIDIDTFHDFKLVEIILKEL